MDSNAVAIASLTILGTAVAGLLWIIKFMFNKFMPMIEKSNKLTDRSIKSTEANTNYLKERNGRDAEIHKKLVAEIQNIPSKITQEVKEQHVEHQDVKKAVVKK